MGLKNKMNNWKTATIILGLLAIGLFSMIMIQANQNYKFEGTDGSIFEISKSNFDLLTANKTFGDRTKSIDIEHRTSAIIINMDRQN